MTDPIAFLHARYRASFPEKRAELLAALVRWRDQPAAADRIATMHRLTHNLSGSAGTYGFVALTELARAADQLLQPHARGGEVLAGKHVALIDAAVSAVCDALASI
ncbi:MAG: Hpt domain-containing protein [Xanthomonadales bacterium]|nr:Hpt domain-containing protein [Xanthomonadales bacterium]MBK7144562.1 Hpt domain-containing protein [Xanthomonadales bacterium]MCC6563092.1 Hpt domain-containing protein [Xanthomonadales bacterium]